VGWRRAAKALHSCNEIGAPIVPIAMTGTENGNIYKHLKSWRRAPGHADSGETVLFTGTGRPSGNVAGGNAPDHAVAGDLLPKAYRGKYKSNHNEKQA
jgi:hypothetical protein